MSDDGIAVYLDGRMLTTRFGSCFCGETQAVLLLARYCENVYADAVIVADVKFKVEPELGVKVPEDCFSNVSYCTFENIPVNVNSCNLPAAFSNDGVSFANICMNDCAWLDLFLRRHSEIFAHVRKEAA